MKRQTFFFLLGAVLGIIASPKVRACSVFNMSHIDKVLAATNKDWKNRETRILFLPAGNGRYGRVYFGYQLEEGFQNVGGMNDQGLWYDGASLPARSDIRNYYNKPLIKGELCEKALEECATVEEVIQMYKTYYTPHWQGHSMWADRYGNSVVIEFGEKDVVFIHKEHELQVMTNFYLSDPENLKWYNCHRFNVITEILEGADTLSVELMTRALDAAHKEGMTPTLFSNVYDLKNGVIHVYHFHNYKEVVHLDLHNELEKGKQYLEMPRLFHGIELIAPFPDDELQGTRVELEWKGAAGTYAVYCSEDESFSDDEEVGVVCLPQHEVSTMGFPCLAIIILLIGLTSGTRKKVSVILLCGLLFLGGCGGCSKIFIAPQYPDTFEGSVIVNGLKKGSTYYWKVVALGENGIDSESVVRSFKLND
jgi:hypothetical protein